MARGRQLRPATANQIAQTVAQAEGNSLTDNARLFALLNFALADAAIVSWDCKYTFDYWRPITAIQLADMDGNAKTEPDPTWTPLLPTPPFPEYTSGHSTFSGAAAVVLAHFYRRDRVSFNVGSDDLPGVFRLLSELLGSSARERHEPRLRRDSFQVREYARTVERRKNGRVRRTQRATTALAAAAHRAPAGNPSRAPR